MLVIILLFLIAIFWALHALDTHLSEKLIIDREVNERLAFHLESVARDSRKAVRQVSETQSSLDENLLTLTKSFDAFIVDTNLALRDLNALTKSDINAARRNELIRTKELKAAIERVISVTTMSRQDPAAQDVLALEAANLRIKELEEIFGGGDR